jgi:hypothetical protein
VLGAVVVEYPASGFTGDENPAPVSHSLLPSMLQASSRLSAVHARSMADAPNLVCIVGTPLGLVDPDEDIGNRRRVAYAKPLPTASSTPWDG